MIENKYKEHIILLIVFIFSLIGYISIKIFCIKKGINSEMAIFIQTIYSSIFMIIISLIMFFTKPIYNIKKSVVYNKILSGFLFILGIYFLIKAVK